MYEPSIHSGSYRLMVLGQVISLLGNSLLSFALSLAILDRTGSAGVFGSTLALSVLPKLVLAPAGGILADRLPRQRIMYALDFLTAGAILLFILLDSGESALPIALLMCALSAIHACYNPSVQSAVPLLVPAEELPKANSIISQVQALSSILGPVAGGFLYGMLSLGGICTLSLICFLASAIMECFLYIPVPARTDGAAGGTSVAGDLKEAGLFIRRAGFLPLLLVAAGLNFFLTPCYNVGLPYFVKVLLGLSSQLYSLVEMSFGVGSILGAVLTAPVSRCFPLRESWIWLLLASLSMAVIALAVAGPWPPLAAWALLVAAALMGALFCSLYSVLFQTFIQSHTPAALLGKVGALTSVVSNCATPLGQGVCGMLMEVLPSWAVPLLYTAACLPLVEVARRQTVKVEEKSSACA